jgi:hypothetical protein
MFCGRLLVRELRQADFGELAEFAFRIFFQIGLEHFGIAAVLDRIPEGDLAGEIGDDAVAGAAGDPAVMSSSMMARCAVVADVEGYSRKMRSELALHLGIDWHFSYLRRLRERTSTHKNRPIA